jgi:hypothetical protein
LRGSTLFDPTFRMDYSDGNDTEREYWAMGPNPWNLEIVRYEVRQDPLAGGLWWVEVPELNIRRSSFDRQHAVELACNAAWAKWQARRILR